MKCRGDPPVHRRQCPTFKEWPDEVIHQLCKHSKIEEVSERQRRGGGGGCGVVPSEPGACAVC